MENSNDRDFYVNGGAYGVLAVVASSLPVPVRRVLIGLWISLCISLALFGFLEPRAEFHYLAM